jgi:hypothetical protein
MWDPSNSPDWLTDASIPAKATSLLPSSKQEILPISLRMTAPSTGPMPGIVMM